MKNLVRRTRILTIVLIIFGGVFILSKLVMFPSNIEKTDQTGFVVSTPSVNAYDDSDFIMTTTSESSSGGTNKKQETYSETTIESSIETSTESSTTKTVPENNKNAEEELFGAYFQQADQLMLQMSLEEKVGQMFVVHSVSNPVDTIKQYHIGGYILFSHDFQNRNADTLRAEVNKWQSASKIPLMLALDEEGGSVIRISKFPQYGVNPFSSPQEIYNSGGLNAIADDTKKKAELILSLNLNVNLAPVADISINPNDYIYSRTLGKPTQETSDYIRCSVEAYHAAGLSCTLKHFPGYGSNLDTHKEIALDNRSASTFRTQDFLPFKAGIDAGAPFILVNHNIISCFDKGMPASLSPAINKILREELA